MKVLNNIEPYIIKLGVEKDMVNNITFVTANNILDCFYISNMKDIMNEFCISMITEIKYYLPLHTKT